jgi:hypothetical protein
VNRNIVISFGLHGLLVIITAMSFPFLSKKPIDLPPIVSVELIQIQTKLTFLLHPRQKKQLKKSKKKKKN